MPVSMPRPLVAPEWLQDHLDEADLRVVDFRWYLDGRSGREAYLAGHIPGAVHVDLDAMTPPDGPGRHPLPHADAFAAAMRAAGVSSGSCVVAYDDAAGSVASRLWWLLRHFGHDCAAVLDGGIQAWPGPLATGDQAVAPGDFTPAPPGGGDVVDFEAVRSRPPGAILLDARLPERFRGDTEPIDPRAGHIPGARTAFWKESVGPGGRMLPPDRLRERFAGLGVDHGDDVIAYCGSGVNATHLLLALELAGLKGGRLYEGSWSDWSRRPDLPAATGPG